LAATYPAEWHWIQEQGAGQIQTENGLFTFTTINPLQEGYRSSSGSGKPYKPSAKNLDPSEYFWVLASHIPSEVMTGHTQALISRLFFIGAGLFLLISFGAWQLALAVTKRRIYQAQLLQMALTDSLTGLPNRKLFFDRLDEGIAHASRYGRRLGLLYIDLDGFKGVNDAMGHGAGDELLIQVGNALKKNLRKADTVARLGGDEFAVLLFEINAPEDARQVGEKIVAALRRPFKLKAGIAQIGASVGAAVFPDHEKAVDTLIKHADAAMYKAKENGKNTCFMDLNGLLIPGGEL
jgi:diguanylate cyclase (GGDEF)-like protein